MTVTQMIARLEAINANFDAITADIEENTKDILIEQQKAQMSAGMLNDGSFIRPPYSAGYKTSRERKGLPVGRVTLRVTGGFYNGIFVVVKDDGKQFINSDKMVGRYNLGNIFTKKYGPKLWGLGGAFKSEYLRAVEQALKTRIKKFLRGNLS